MTAPDSDAEGRPDKAEATPEALAAGQRTLAAIVFTDTVGSSALMRKDEEGALRLLARDSDRMKATCVAFGGQVLKSTGDGLLMLFTSAVQAVACALEIQREFQRQNLELPREEQLQHRIGIHLGDVFQHNGDVMGDGVNVAARLQTQAVPGGICLSNTVYDVVHNRLSFYVNDLGARKLKNIGTVTAYQISPSDSGQARFRVAWYRWRHWFWMAVIAVGFLVLIGGVYKWGQSHGIIKSRQHEEAKNAKVKAEREKNATASETNAPASAVVVQPSSVSELEIARHDYMPKYDFEGMVEWIETHDWPGKKTEKLEEKCVGFAHLFGWTRDHLSARSAEKPLIIHGPGGKKTAYWPVFGGLKMKSEGRTTTLYREAIPPAMMAAIVREMMLETALSEDDAGQLDGELNAFIEYYHVKTPGESTVPEDAAGKH